ncbi:MAG: DUF5076 domain-containing protein [Rhizobiales bacterium]|nr:DUF5076 domain-containing protein [Hyphomicrobiales bacterium]
MSVPFDVLQLPPAALERGGLEILRAGVIDGSLHVALRRTFDDPQAWGMALAEIARHVARIYAMETGTAEAVTLERIRNMLDAEFDAPSSAGTTQALK